MRILIIENDLKVKKFLKSGLESQLYIVDETTNGAQGLFFSRTNKYDLIILSTELDILSGQEILKKIRNDKNFVPIIVISNENDIDKKRIMYNLGADDYLVKPISIEEITLKIKAILNRPPQIKAKILNLDNLNLNEQAKTVKRGNRKINLTNKEYNLLRFLFNRKGEVLTRTEIMEKVWDINADPLSNSIEAHIMNLRKKLNKVGEKNFIHTLNGRGYKLDISKN